jgi:hypothetical protein
MRFPGSQRYQVLANHQQAFGNNMKIIVNVLNRSAFLAFGFPGCSLVKNGLARSIGGTSTTRVLPDDAAKWELAQLSLLHASGKRTTSTAKDTKTPGKARPVGPLNWREHFMEYLQTVCKDPLGSFACSQRLKDAPYLFPALSVEGVGSVPMPLVDSVAEQLKSVARKAPFGVGNETHLDDEVRNCWEIDASQVSAMQSAESQDYFVQVVQECCYQLGISKTSFEERKIRANLYKMLLYEKDGHFLSPRQ